MRPIAEALSYLLEHRDTIVLVKFGSRIAPHAETRGLTKSIRMLMEHGIRFVLVCPSQEDFVLNWPSLEGVIDRVASNGICSSETVHEIANSCIGGQLPVVTISMSSDELLDDAIVALARDLNAELASHPRFNVSDTRVAKIIFLTHQPGIMNNWQRLVRQMDLETASDMLSAGTVDNGMRAKLAAAIRACREVGIERVHIVSGEKPDVLVGELLTATGVGTMVYGERIYPSVQVAEPSDAYEVQQLIQAAKFVRTLSFQEVVEAIEAHQCYVATLDGHIQACGMLNHIQGTGYVLAGHWCGYSPHDTPESLKTLADTKFGELARYGMQCVLFPTDAYIAFPGMYTRFLPTNRIRRIGHKDIPRLGLNADRINIPCASFMHAPLDPTPIEAVA